MSGRQYSSIQCLTLKKDPSDKWGLGVGVELNPPFHVTIRNISEGTPSARSVLKKGDRITRVNGKYTVGLQKEIIYEIFRCDEIEIEYTTPMIQRSEKKNGGVTVATMASSSAQSGRSQSASSQLQEASKLSQKTNAGNAYPITTLDSLLTERSHQASVSDSNPPAASTVPSHRNPVLNATTKVAFPSRTSVGVKLSRVVIDLVSDSDIEEEDHVVEKEVNPPPVIPQPKQQIVSNVCAHPIRPSTSWTAGSTVTAHPSGDSNVFRASTNGINNVIELLDDSDEEDDTENMQRDVSDYMFGDSSGDDSLEPDLSVLDALLDSDERVDVQRNSTDRPSLKRKRSSVESENATSSPSGNFFCGIKVKLEPAGFGFADTEDVTEVKNPTEEIGSREVVKSNDLNAVIVGGEDDDEDISYVGGNTATMLEMPHARESCPQFPFIRPNMMMASNPSNLKFCDFCYCYVCEIKATECPYWKSHSQATHKNVVWKQERALLRSKLLSLLNPPTRRASFIQEKLKPKILEVGSFAPSHFKGTLDEIKPTMLAISALRKTGNVNQPSVSDFLEIVILLVNVLKRCQNDIRDGSQGYRAMSYLCQALLATNMFSMPFSTPDVAQAIQADLSSLQNPIVIDFLNTLLLLTKPNSQEMADWVYCSRLDNRKDVPISVGKVKSLLVAGVVFSALKDIGACPAAVLEFCYRQGDRFTASCFHWLISSANVEAAKLALDRIPSGSIHRELGSQFADDKSIGKKPGDVLKFCTLLAVIGPKYASIANVDDLMATYTSLIFRSGSVVENLSKVLFKTFSTADRCSLVPYIDSLTSIRQLLGGGSDPVRIFNIPKGQEIQALYFLLFLCPSFTFPTIAYKLPLVRRMVSQVILKEACASCKMLFLYYLEAWGAIASKAGYGSSEQLRENISAITCEIAREIISKESSALLLLPSHILNYWGDLSIGFNLQSLFVRPAFTLRSDGLFDVTSLNSNLTPSLASSYVPLYLYSNLQPLKLKDISEMPALMPLMWKSFVATSLDYILNANRFKMSNLKMFMQLLQGLDMDEKLSIMLREVVLMHLFFDAISSSYTFSASNDSDDYKLTELLRRIVNGLRKPADGDQTRWLFWQALLSRIVKTVMPENKYDILNLIIIEDWITLNESYFSGKSEGLSKKTSKLKALLQSRPRDVDIENKTACMFLWQSIARMSSQVIDSLASSRDPTLLNTLLYHAADNISDLSPHLKSAAMVRSLHKMLSVKDVPTKNVANVKWEDLRKVICENLEAICKDENALPSRNDVLLAVVLELSKLFSILFPRLTSVLDLVELFRQCISLNEVVFVVENTSKELRHAVLRNPTFRQQLSLAIQSYDFFDELHTSCSLAIVELFAILFPTVETITKFMSQKDKFDTELVANVFSHFQHLLTNNFEESNISVSDAFQLFTEYSDESCLRDFFFYLYSKKINPLISTNFIEYSFAHVQKKGLNESAMVMSWLVAFCYRFHDDMSRSILNSMQECFVVLMRDADTSDLIAPENATPADIYECSFKVEDEEDLQLFRPAYALQFMQLIIFPKVERYEKLPTRLLSTTMKKNTLIFLFDIEHPEVFVMTVFKTEEFAILNEKVNSISFGNPHWQKILEAIVFGLKANSMGSGIGVETELTTPQNHSVTATEFFRHSLQFLVNLQIMRSQSVSQSRSGIISDLFEQLSSQLQPSEQNILDSMIAFKCQSVIKSLSEESNTDAKCAKLGEFCHLMASGNWRREDKITIFFELQKLSMQLDVVFPVYDVPLTTFTQPYDFRIPMGLMMTGVLPEILGFLDSSESGVEDVYVSNMQLLIDSICDQANGVVMCLLPSIIECLGCKHLRTAVLSSHQTSNCASTVLWAQLIDSVSSGLNDKSRLDFIKFLGRVHTSLVQLIPTDFVRAAQSAERNGILKKWLTVLSDAIQVEDIHEADVVGLFLFSIPKHSMLYPADFWRNLYGKISHVPLVAARVLTDSVVADPSLLNVIVTHAEVTEELTVNLTPLHLFTHGDFYPEFASVWEHVVTQKESDITAMVKNAVQYLCRERLTVTKKAQLTDILLHLKGCYTKAGKIESWNKLCRVCAAMSVRKKAMQVIFNSAVVS